MAWLERTYADLSRPVEAFTFTVDATGAGQRVDALLRVRYPWKSRAHYQRLVEQGDVRLDGRLVKPSTRVRAGQQVLVRLPADPRAPALESSDDLVFLYEDEHVAAIDKPSGMTVHPVGRIRHGTLINKLHARYRREGGAEDVVPRLGHRLDQDTSGVVLVVKSRAVDVLVTEAFTHRRVAKTYLAIVQGVPSPAWGIVDAPIGRDPEAGTRLHMAVRPDGQGARTRWHVERAFARHALVRLEPLTGRTHQLRVHMAHLGHPILCDHLYGDLRPLYASAVDGPGRGPADPAADEAILARLALHASRLELDHPVTGEPLVLESPLPPDLVRALERLDGGAARASARAAAGGRP